jgi:hypothetical protein
MWNTAFDYHFFSMLLEYQRVVNLAASGLDGSTSGKVTPSSISQAMKAMRIKKLAKVKLVALVLCFATILLQQVDEVAHPVHFHSFNAFSHEVDDKPRDLCWSVLPDELTNNQQVTMVQW